MDRKVKDLIKALKLSDDELYEIIRKAKIPEEENEAESQPASEGKEAGGAESDSAPKESPKSPKEEKPEAESNPFPLDDIRKVIQSEVKKAVTSVLSRKAPSPPPRSTTDLGFGILDSQYGFIPKQKKVE